MKRLLSVCIMLGSAFVLGQTNSDQDSSSIAVIEFTSTGISDLETQTLSNYFFSELEKATDKQFMNPSRIKDKISDLEMGKSDCYTKECLQGGLDALGVHKSQCSRQDAGHQKGISAADNRKYPVNR